jgi:hypothetical protein
MANSSGSGKGTQGGTHEQHVKAGQQSHKDNPAKDSDQMSQGTGSSKSGTQGGTHEQHVKAGQQSHKNTDSGSRNK